MKNLFLALTAVVFSVASMSSASGELVYSENFNSLTVGTTLDASSANWNAASTYPVEAGNANFATNHLAVTAAADNFNFANWDDGTARSLMTVSFDVVDPGGMTGTEGMRIATSRATSNGSLVNLTGATLADNTVFHYDIVTNISTSAVLYEDGINSVGATSYDVWVNGEQTVFGDALVGAGAGDIDGVGLWARRPGAAFRVDNLEFRNTAFTQAVPEPSSLAMLGLLGLGFFRRKRA